MITVAPATESNFEIIWPYLAREGSKKITRAMWHGFLEQRWRAPEEHFGYALLSDGKVVGFLGYLFSVQNIEGVERRFCNVSTFVVDPEHRNQSLRLVAPLAALRDHTLVNVTPSPDAYKIFRALGFQHLDAEVTALLPVASPLTAMLSPVTDVFFDEDVIARRLGAAAGATAGAGGDAARVFADHRGLAATHMLVTLRGESLYVLASRRSYRNIPFVHVHHVSDPDLLARVSDAARVALMTRLRAPLVMIDKRLLRGVRINRSMSRPYPSPLLFRSRELTPAQVSNAYTELTVFPV